ncbi:MAG: hypothetical protein M4579_000951 [Chaenotheca gracillima]|nr:MAG: hypothetical protein M4579_000951 [Chaenotheca gracillima]
MDDYPMAVLPTPLKPQSTLRDRRRQDFDGLRRHPAKEFVTSVAVNEVHEDDLGKQSAGPPKANGPKRNPSDSRKHARQNSLRHANSVELMHKRWRSGSGTHLVSEGNGSSRGGHQFTVGNVGSNGTIFLRPVVRSGNQRHSPPQFIFPASSHDNNQLAVQTHSDRRSNEGLQDESASATPTPTPTQQHHPSPHRLRRSSQHEALRPGSQPIAPPQHSRTQSCSTIDDKARAHNTDAGGFRVVIDRPPQPRPRTADGPIPPTLEVPIPHYRLGTPRFSARGTAFLHSSIYTRTSTNDDLRSSVFSQGNFDALFPVPPGMERPPLSSRWNSRPSATASQGMRSSSGEQSGDHLMNPSIYDDLTFGPKSESPTVIRYCPASGNIVAATPARLIAQITSPNFLDYELLSDFFLTYRSFMSAYDLVAYLMARMQWASDRQDEVGKIVRVRTFVAMRHWILNYFVDDFVPDFTLRAAFCESLNRLCTFLKQTQSSQANAFKIIGQLKKCWRRTYALYWDGNSRGHESDADEDIFPGGPAGSRQDHIDTPKSTAGLAIDAVPPAHFETGLTLDGKGPGRTHAVTADGRSRARELRHSAGQSFEMPALSPTSEISAPVVSCSFPAKATRRPSPSSGRHAAHPIHLIGIPSPNSHPHAAPPSSMARMNRPVHNRKRSGSFTDALRDDRATTHSPGSAIRRTQTIMAFPFAESLIRGNVFPPPQPFVTEIAPLTPTEKLRAADFFSPVESHRHAGDTLKVSGTAGSGPGMKKLLGSVRRAWSTKTPSDSPNSSISTEIGSSPPLPSTKISQSVRPNTAHARPTQKLPPAPRMPLRIDLLAANISEAFKKLAKEQEGASNHQWPISTSAAAKRYDGETTPRLDASPASARRPAHSMVTDGSRSIVIIDDTREPLPPLFMSGGLPYSSTGSAVDEDGNFSHLQRPSFEAEESVPLVLDGEGNSVSSEPREQDSIEPVPPIPQHIYEQQPEAFRRPGVSPVSQAVKSAIPSRGKSFKSTQSDSLRRLASYQSEVSKRAKQSFDATTVTDSGMDSFAGPRQPERVLRRRPGGDLRAAKKILDLEQMMRPRSAGSLTTRTGSMNSILPTSDDPAANIDPSANTRRRYSLGALAENTTGQGTSMIQTHSSQPNLRPSFEAEVAKLAQLPDDEDDGGVESTLLKLEGKFERTSSGEISPLQSFEPSTERSGSEKVLSVESSGGYNSEELRSRQADAFDQLASAIDMSPQETSIEPVSSQESTEPMTAGLRPREQPRDLPEPISPSIRSEDSYSSIPLLERGLADEPPQPGTQSRPWSDMATPRPLQSKALHLQVQHSEPSFEYVEETDSMRKIPKGATMPPSDIGDESFLLDDDEDLSDISSEYSTEMVTRPVMSRESSATFPGAHLAARASDVVVPTQTLPPPSPPLTTEKTLSMEGTPHPNQFQNSPPTPVRTPTTRDPLQRTISMPKMHQNVNQMQKPVPLGSAGLTNNSVHLCFILEFDSDLLAQQFTLIEKYALNEVDWKELVEMRSKEPSSVATDWVDFLKSGEQGGVELVIARFNIMVKWALSEIVMTQSIEERARTISKYIHIAAHCRRYRNYATMYQITIALLSADCSRLAKTWQLVPATDMLIFKDLEALVQPMRNFHKLRVEMETSLAEGGCIPFIGIYTHDLVFNAQRPEHQDLSPPGGEPLVNFERHRTTAAVVKSLLRLLEASSKYNFPPVEDALSKCLWMAKLPDDDIHWLSKQLE